MAIDKVTLEVLNNFTHAVVETMAYTLTRTAYSTFIRETQDFTTAIVTPEGEIVAYPQFMASLWLMAINMGEAIQVIKEYEEGDIIISNDPYSSKFFVTHTPDFHLWKPIFHKGKIVCFTTCHVHYTDVGGTYPATVSRQNNEIFQEGIRIPPQKLYRKGVLNEDLVEIIKNNVRIPEQNWGDLKAQVACVNTGEQKVREMIERFGIDVFREGMYALLDYGEKRVRALISEIPDGSYSFHDYLDDDVVSDMPVRIALTMKVERDEIILDFTGTDPQLDCAMNMPTGGREKHGIPAIGLYFYFLTLDPKIPVSGAVMRPITLIMPKGTLMNPEYPAAVGVRTTTMPRIADAILGCLIKAKAKMVPACPSGHVTMLVVSLHDPKTGIKYVSSINPSIGGGGASAFNDGTNVIGGFTNSLSNTPTEITEAEVPVFIRRFELIKDSGGAGKHRGGLGVRFDFQVPQPNARVTARNRERSKFQPWGVMGGQPARASRFVVNPGEGERERELGNIDVVALKPGDIVSISSPGGGGYGSPLERDPETVLNDVRSGYVSRESAENDYGVIIHEDRVDTEATKQLRTRMKSKERHALFNFGKEREVYESVWTDRVYDVLTDLLMKMPAPIRSFAKKEIYQEVTLKAKTRQIEAEDIIDSWRQIKAKYGLAAD